MKGSSYWKIREKNSPSSVRGQARHGQSRWKGPRSATDPGMDAYANASRSTCRGRTSPTKRPSSTGHWASARGGGFGRPGSQKKTGDESSAVMGVSGAGADACERSRAPGRRGSGAHFAGEAGQEAGLHRARVSASSDAIRDPEWRRRCNPKEGRAASSGLCRGRIATLWRWRGQRVRAGGPVASGGAVHAS